MSSTEEVLEPDQNALCASCGIAVDKIKFPIGGMSVTLDTSFECNGVRCCSVECREENEERHDEECNELREELHDKKIFTQPDGTHLGECPICFLPMPLDRGKFMFHTCCSETVCMGCVDAHYMSGGGDKCPFCREPVVVSEEKSDERLMKRVKANDPAAMRHMGGNRYKEGDYDGAFEYLTKAADLGDVEAYYQLGLMHYEGEGVEKDEEKSIYHYEKAAIGGHPIARYLLAVMEARNGNMERAAKHHIIAANLGHEKSIKALRIHCDSLGNITKEDLDATLRSHQAAIDAMKSPEREAAYEYLKTQEAIQLHDKELFQQPEISHLGECPICFLPLSLDKSKSILKSCCSKLICSGCVCANIKCNINDPVKGWSCPLCRDPCDEKYGKRNIKKLMKRVKANDPAALCEIGKTRHQEGKFDAAFKYLTKAAELGDASAHHNLSCMYRDGQGVKKDEGKEIHHAERAAIGGHPDARFKLACYERDKNYKRAVKHLIIGANLGCNKSMDMLWEVFRCGGYVTKEDLEAALRGHKAAIDATKSEQRDAAECGAEWRQIIIAQMRR